VTAPGARVSRPRYFERWTYEARVLASALAVALPALIALVAMLVAYEHLLDWLWILVLPVAFATLWLATRLRNSIVYPLYTLSNLLEALREGDYSLRGSRAKRNDAIGEVVWEINTLSQTLRDQRLKVEETSALLTKVITATDIAIFSFDVNHRLTLVTAAGERVLAQSAQQLRGKTADDLGLADWLVPGLPHTEQRAFPGGSGRWEVRHATFREGGLPHDLLVITDLSRALREEERQAWQRLIRVLGHELNNSLAPIKSMAGTLHKLLRQETQPHDWRDDALVGLGVIGDRAEALTRFLIGYATLARLPVPSKTRVELGTLVSRVVLLEQRLAVSVDAQPIALEADADQIEQALINLVKNAVEATLPGGGGVRVVCRRESRAAIIEVIDDGPGLPPTENLFVPFFTTKPGGSGIGLVLARQIAEAHGGWLSLENRGDAHGCIARLSLPL
jgi:two-component system, NtrC family, nitrogen regulation sensor histidine kinase NtrY